MEIRVALDKTLAPSQHSAMHYMYTYIHTHTHTYCSMLTYTHTHITVTVATIVEHGIINVALDKTLAPSQHSAIAADTTVVYAVDLHTVFSIAESRCVCVYVCMYVCMYMLLQRTRLLCMPWICIQSSALLSQGVYVCMSACMYVCTCYCSGLDCCVCRGSAYSL